VAIFSSRSWIVFEHAGHEHAFASGPADFEGGPDYAGAVFHNAQSHTARFLRLRNETTTIVGHSQAGSIALRGQPHCDFPGLAMLDGVVDGLLRDAVKVRGGGVISQEHRLGTFKAAGDVKQFPGVGRQLELKKTRLKCVSDRKPTS
jgi:hypothetical protein